jgi:hypothetical protein
MRDGRPGFVSIDDINQINGAWAAARAEIAEWEKATGCMTATGAGELIRQLRERAENAEAQAQRICLPVHGIAPKDGEAVFAVTQSQLDKMDAENRKIRAERHAAEMKAEKLSAQLVERDQDLLSANAEIDRVRKAAQTLGLVSDQSAELAKVKAELATKCREAQTAKENAEAAECKVTSWVSLVKDARVCAGLPEKLGEGEALIDWCREAREKLNTYEANGRNALIVFDRIKSAIAVDSLVDVAQWVEDAQKKLASAIISFPKPDKVEPGQKWAMVVKCNRAHADGQGGEFFLPNGEMIHLWPRAIQNSIYLGP